MGQAEDFGGFCHSLCLRDIDNMGWSRMAEAYKEITGQYISRDTIKRRYLEAKDLDTKDI